MKKIKIIFLLLIVFMIVGILIFYKMPRYIIGVVEEVNDYVGTAIIMPIEMSTPHIISDASFLIKTNIPVQIGDTLKINIKPPIKYFFKSIFNPSIDLSVSPARLPKEIKYSIEIIKK